MDDVLSRLADAAGIENHYWDMHGNRYETSPETMRSLLKAFGIAADTEQDAAASLAAMHDAPWRSVLPPVAVLQDGDAVSIPLHLARDDAMRTIRWTVHLETGGRRRGETRLEVLPQEGSAQIGGRHIDLRRLGLEALPLGYHRLEIEDGAVTSTKLIVAPRRCYVPPRLTSRRAWGLMLQLYSLKSHSDWGIGDFGDLRMLIDRVAAADGDAIGLNPLHALFLDTPEDASPYSPCSRLFRNPFYLDVPAVADFAECGEARTIADSGPFQQALAACRQGEFVKYDVVAQLKLPVLEKLYTHFVATHLAAGDSRATAFRAYIAGKGRDLEALATFQVLCERHRTHDWSRWPQEHRDPESTATAEFRAGHAERIGFFQYLQWLCEEQFAAAAEQARARGMAVGLYNDLAVSVDSSSADHWSHQAQFASGARVGAPPDPFNESGQDWGVVPLNPLRLRESGYGYFISLLRANMRHAGALRIDHVMGLQRLFLIPPGAKATGGAYVRYPIQDLLAVASLESQRNRCLIIGEDLGTVPDGFREKLAEANVYSSRVLYFERQWDRFSPPQNYPGQAAVSISTHDLATFHGYWNGDDIAAKASLGLFKTPEEEHGARGARAHDKRQLLQALADEGLLPEGVWPDQADHLAWTPQLTQAVHAYLARSPSSLLMVQMDDLTGQVHQANLPGSILEYPNWRRRLTRPLEEVTAEPALHAAMTAIAASRAQRS